MRVLILFLAVSSSIFACSPTTQNNSTLVDASLYPHSTLSIENTNGNLYDSKIGFKECLNFFPAGKTPVLNVPATPLCFSNYAVLFSPITKKPIVSIEHLSRESRFSTVENRTEDFHEENRLPLDQRSQLSDYVGSGYDRGHNAPAGDMPTDVNYQAMSESFSLANIMPQAPQNNRKTWATSVESATRKFASRANGDVFVYTGSSGSLGVIGPNKVTVPSYIWKLVYDQASHRAWAYWIPNTNDATVTGVISYQQLLSNIKQVDGTVLDFQLPQGI